MENLACSLFHNELVAGHCGHAARSLALSLGDDGEIVLRPEAIQIADTGLLPC